MTFNSKQYDKSINLYDSAKLIENRILELVTSNITIQQVLGQYRTKKVSDKESTLSEYIPQQVLDLEIIQRQHETEIKYLRALKRTEEPSPQQRLKYLRETTDANSLLKSSEVDIKSEKLDPWGTVTNPR